MNSYRTATGQRHTNDTPTTHQRQVSYTSTTHQRHTNDESSRRTSDVPVTDRRPWPTTHEQQTSHGRASQWPRLEQTHERHDPNGWTSDKRADRPAVGPVTTTPVDEPMRDEQMNEPMRDEQMDEPMRDEQMDERRNTDHDPSRRTSRPAERNRRRAMHDQTDDQTHE